MHPLYRKKSMDAVNEALLKPTEYPAADKEYNHPMWFKGTEPESIKTGSVQRFKNCDAASRKVADLDYDEICARTLFYLRQLSLNTSDLDVRACADATLKDLQFFFDQEKAAAPVNPRTAGSHTAEIELHTGPEKGGAPNMGARSLLDEDAKEDIKEQKGGYKRVGSRRTRFSSPLFASN
jgi:hypothetical protein